MYHIDPIFINRLGSVRFTSPSKFEPQPGWPSGQPYDLKNDPGEEHNLFLEEPEKVEELKVKLEKLVD